MRLSDADDDRVPVVTNLCHDLARAVEAEAQARTELERATANRKRIENDITRYVGYIERSAGNASVKFESGYWQGLSEEGDR